MIRKCLSIDHLLIVREKSKLFLYSGEIRPVLHQLIAPMRHRRTLLTFRSDTLRRTQHHFCSFLAKNV